MNLPNQLIAAGLMKDERIKQAKGLILNALKEHCNKIKGIRPPYAELKLGYHQLIEKFSEYRGGKLWFPYLGSGIGKGPFVELMDGSVKYDCICGIGPHIWGHSNPILFDAAMNAALSDTVMQGNLQQNIDSLELTEFLLQHSGFDHCFLSSSGAMANENAFKVAFQKKSPAQRILAFNKCFAGRSMLESQITDKPAFREGLPSNYHIDYIPFYNPEAPQESTEASISALHKHISRYPKQHAVMILELVQGEGGFNTGSESYFKTIINVLKEYEIAVFIDEIQTFARTPSLFAFQYFHLEDMVDIVSIGKVSQVCATLFRKEFKPQAGLLSQTFTGSTSAIQIGKAMMENLIKNNFYGVEGKIQSLHNYFTGKLSAIAEKHPGLIKGPFGLGSMVAFTPYKGESHKATHLVHELYEAGVITFIAGMHPTRVRLLLPVGAVSFEDLDIIANIIETTLLKGIEHVHH